MFSHSFLGIYHNEMIVYKKTDEWNIQIQRVTTSSTISDNKWQGMVQRITTLTTIGTTSDNEWQRVQTNGNDWCSKWQHMITCGTTKKTTESKLQQVKESNFRFQNEAKCQSCSWRVFFQFSMHCITTIYSR